MFECSSDDSSVENSEYSDEIIIRRTTRSRKLIDDIKDNPDLYTTRRSERNRKEPSRFDNNNNEVQHRSRLCRPLNSDSSTDNDDDSDYMYSNRSKKRNYQPKMEVRKRARVSYKEAVTSDDDNDSGDIGEPNKKSQKVNGKENGKININDNPILNKPTNLIRTSVTGESGIDKELFEEEENKDDQNVIEEVINSRLGRIGDTGNSTTFYNQKLKTDNSLYSYNQQIEPQYLIKWKGWSHIHCTWESESSLLQYNYLEGIRKFYIFQDVQKHRENWKNNYASPEDLDAEQFEEERNETLLQQKFKCDRILDTQRDKKSDCVNYLVKWETLDYRYSTWESGKIIMEPLYQDAIREYNARCRSVFIANKRCDALTRRPKFTPIREQPDYLKHNSELLLRDYQLDGLNWLARSWTRGNSVILADEMGLGKTIQTICFLSYLFNEHAMYGPFLIVLPLSTISGWQKEFANWAPYMNVIYYTGDGQSRQIIREREWYFPEKKMLKFHVCVTTYELLLKDKMWFNQISWACLGIDEAHRLKNDESQLYQALFTFDTNTRLLITGTPVHNSLKELWALLHFIMPDRFENWTYFEEKYNIFNESGAATEAVNDLYKVLEPFLIRRIKKDVEKSLPSKSEQIIRVPMCRKQAELYKIILTKNYDALCKETRGRTSSFLNVVMELKKCCNHTQLVTKLDEETEQNMNPESRLRYLIKSSGKMMLLDKLLFELRDKGHRVLIFSQMVRMLDIISDYLALRGWGFQRLDGSINGTLRKQAIDHFNGDGSTDFCFLLSTRAGGLGINLATADTVILFDSDWNPQNDLQAMARAHRIGQKKQVSVYRFVIKNSVEEKIIECAKRKMVLDHLVIQRMDSALNRKTEASKNQPFNKEELNEILKFGAADLFNQAEQLDDDHELNIQELLQRAETRDTDEENHNPANELLSAFKVVNISETAEDEDIVYIGQKGKSRLWSEIVPQQVRDRVKEDEQQKALIELELGPRQRNKVKAYQVLHSGSQDSDGSDQSSEKGDKFTEKEIRTVLRVMRKFPRPLERVQSIIVEAEIIYRSEKDVYELLKRIIDGCQTVMNECDTEEMKNKASFTIGKIVISPKSLLQAIEYLEVLHDVLPGNKDDRLAYELPFETKFANWSCLWETEDDAKLLVGVYERGLDNWEAIKMDLNLKLTSKILPSSNTERPQSSHLRTRVEYLLKRLRTSKDIIKPNTTIKEVTIKVPKTLHKTGQVYIAKSSKLVESSDNNEVSEILKMKSISKSKLDIKIAKMEEVDREKKVNNSDVSEDEKEFYNMRGALFDRCTKHMKPIKEQLKYLEDKQRLMGEKINADDKSLCDCLLLVGDHIRTVIDSFATEGTDKRKWRIYLWSFVNFFFDVWPTEHLHRIYKNAYKKSLDRIGMKNDDDKKVLLRKEVKSNVEKPNFEAKSYHEYKLKMNRLSGGEVGHNLQEERRDREGGDHESRHRVERHRRRKEEYDIGRDERGCGEYERRTERRGGAYNDNCKNIKPYDRSSNGHSRDDHYNARHNQQYDSKRPSSGNGNHLSRDPRLSKSINN